MLITFRCKVHANVTMFGDVGLQMLHMMGHSGTVPGSISAQDVPEALSKLKTALELEKRATQQAEPDQDEDDDFLDEPVSVSNRALPLLELLSAASKEECDVMWDKS